MKQYLISAIAILFATTASAQKETLAIRSNDISTKEIINVLNAMDVKIYSFDLKELTKEPHSLYIYVDSHQDSTVKEVFRIPVKRNMRYISDFPEASHAEVREMYNLSGDDQICYTMDRLSVYMIPSNDSTIKVVFNIENYGRMSYRMKLNPVITPDSRTFFYSDRPFKLENIKESEKTPLILHGSGWYDKDANVVRMCGESELESDLSKNKILEKVPQYYIIGIKAEKTDK